LLTNGCCPSRRTHSVECDTRDSARHCFSLLRWTSQVAMGRMIGPLAGDGGDVLIRRPAAGRYLAAGGRRNVLRRTAKISVGLHTKTIAGPFYGGLPAGRPAGGQPCDDKSIAGVPPEIIRRPAARKMSGGRRPGKFPAAGGGWRGFCTDLMRADASVGVGEPLCLDDDRRPRDTV
jgi:hypothetical protein